MKKLTLALAIATLSFNAAAQVTELPDKEDDKTKTEVIVENIVPVPEVNVTVPEPNVQVTNDIAAPQVNVYECRPTIKSGFKWSFDSYVVNIGVLDTNYDFIITDMEVDVSNGHSSTINTIFYLNNGGDAPQYYRGHVVPDLAVGDRAVRTWHFESGIRVPAGWEFALDWVGPEARSTTLFISGYVLDCG